MPTESVSNSDSCARVVSLHCPVSTSNTDPAASQVSTDGLDGSKHMPFTVLKNSMILNLGCWKLCVRRRFNTSELVRTSKGFYGILNLILTHRRCPDFGIYPNPTLIGIFCTSSTFLFK